MELNDRVCQDIAHVDSSALLEDQWVLLQHQPSNVGKEEAAIGVVRIGIGFRVLMMNSMISDPIVKCVL